MPSNNTTGPSTHTPRPRSTAAGSAIPESDLVYAEHNNPVSLPKSARLLSADKFQRVFAQADYRASHRYCLILARANALSRPRLGLVIAKKHVRLAVQRNRIKRLIRESFRQRQHQLPPIDAIVLARNSLDQLDNRRITTILEQLWQKLEKQARN